MAETPFDSLDDFIALPRITSLEVAPDGSRIVVGVAALDAEKTAWVTNLWTVDPAGETAPRRLTRGEKGESTVAFTPGGDLLFVAKRASGADDDAPAALWLLPAGGGEPRVVATHPGGFSSVQVRGTTALLAGGVLPGSTSLEDDRERRAARKDKKVAALLHSSYPVRYWDHDVGPDETRLYIADVGGLGAARAGLDEPMLELRDVTADAGRRLGRLSADLAPDGSFVVASWTVFEPRADQRDSLVRIDTANGERTTLADDPDHSYSAPHVSPDSRSVVYVETWRSTPHRAPDNRLAWMDLESGETRVLLGEWDNWPGDVAWLPNGTGLVMAADTDGRSPLFSVPLDGAPPVRLTGDGAFSAVAPLPDSTAVAALRSSCEAPNEPVVVSLDGAGAAEFAEGTAAVRVLDSPAPPPALPGHLTEVETTADDGARVRAWLALPPGASDEEPAPLLLWIHGGPLGSWNAWSWRWCPWVMVAKGYAVLLPDPALSTGYGRDFIQRGWGAWGAAPFTDLMAITTTAEERGDIDASRTAAMGGSFGGYMANWVAGHTDRFAAIVTHASLWALDQFGPTTDMAVYWERELTPEMGLAHSPHRSVEAITTPMLVIHGDRDYRVPIGEGLRLWYELLSKSGLPAGEDGATVHRFLYFPNENHWILSPQHARVWYDVVLGFLGEHVLGTGPAPANPLLE